MNTQIHEDARRAAYNTLDEVNRHLNSGNVRRADQRRLLHDMADRATNTLRNLDDLDNRRMDNVTAYELINDALNKILPHLDNYADDATSARYGRRRVRARGYTRRADMDDYDYDDNMDDAENRRQKRDRYGRFKADDDMTNAMTRAAADAAAATARNMTNNVYPPHVPVMPRYDNDRARYDADRTRNDTDRTRSDAVGPNATR